MGSTLTGIGGAIGGALLGPLGLPLAGAMKGAQGTPDQKQFSYTRFAPKTPEQLELERLSREQFLKGLSQVDAQEQDIFSRLGLQQQARDVMARGFTGDLFRATPEELDQIRRLRDAQVAQSRFDIQNLLTENLGRAEASAAQRGVRGQALSQFQGDQVRAAAENLQRAINQAEAIAAQQEIQMPMQRAQAQLSSGAGFTNFADQLRQQAILNRLQYQNPALLQQYQQERLAGATKEELIPGRKGDFWDALIGMRTGLGAELAQMGQIMKIAKGG